MKKLAVVLMIAIACIQATGGFAIGENMAKKSSVTAVALETRLAEQGQ